MASAGLSSVEALRQLQAHPDGEGMPDLPTPDQLELIQEVRSALGVVLATVDSLQKDDVLLASYLPLSSALRTALLKQGSAYARPYVSELNGVEERNLRRPFSVGPSTVPWEC